MNNSERDLHSAIEVKDQLELLANHGIDPTFFAPWSIKVGISDDFCRAIEKWGHEKCLDTTHGQTGTRAGIHRQVRNRIAPGENGWSLYSVLLNQKGYPQAGKAYVGHRIHPSMRIDGGLKFDCSGRDAVNRGLMLPPLSLTGAIDLLEDNGFEPDSDSYEPWQAWEFVRSNPTIPLFIEESALKAMASCSVGQLAIGINGINGYGQKGRSDRLHPCLNRMAKGDRQIIVRFDRPEKTTSQSQFQAQKLSRQLEKAGAAGGGWWCWPPGVPAKSDDFVAAIAREELSDEQKRWRYYFVSNSDTRSAYKRIQKEWTGLVIDREFRATDVLSAAENNRIVVLKGATGTAKSTAMVEALELLEAKQGEKMIVLGCYHRSSLVHKGSAEYGVVNLSAPRESPERLGLHEGGTMRDGMFCCGESAYKTTGEISLWDRYLMLKDKPRPTLLNLDEISQVLPNWTIGGTEALKQVRGKALKALEGLIGLDCVRVWASDALVGDIEIEWLEGLSGQPVYLLSSTYTRPRELYLGRPTPENERRVLLHLTDVVRSEERFWLGHGTVAGLHRIMEALPEAGQESELRITGETCSRADQRVTCFLADTENEGPKYTRIGFTPAMSCGISMAGTEVALTTVVQEYCWRAEDVLQALNRARQSHRRILLAPKVLPSALGVTRETSPERATQALCEMMEAGAIHDYEALLLDLHPATLRAIAHLEARRNLECLENDWCLRGMLKEEGYLLREIEELDKSESEDDTVTTGRIKSSDRSLSGIQRYRTEALQRLALGTTTLNSEQSRARREVEGGGFLDLAEVDVSETWTVAQSLHLDELIRAGTVHRESPEVTAVWESLSTLNKDDAKRVARALGTRANRIPGPMDSFDVRKIWPLLTAMGFSYRKGGQTRAEGKRWTITPTDPD